MSEQPTTRGQLAIDTYLDSLESRGELIPAGRTYLARRFASSNPHGGLKSLVSFLACPESERYKNPEYTPPAKEAPLRAICRRLGGLLATKEDADALYDYMAIRIDPADLQKHQGAVAWKVWTDLNETPELRRLWHEKYRPPLAHRQARVAAALDALDDRLPARLKLPSARDAICEKYKDAAGDKRPIEEVVRIVSSRLSRDGFIDEPAPEDVRAAAMSASRASAAPDEARDKFRAEWAASGGYEPF